MAIHQLKDVRRLTHPGNRSEHHDTPQQDASASTAQDLITALADEAREEVSATDVCYEGDEDAG